MSQIDYRYTVDEVRGLQLLTYWFISLGQKNVLKIIQYTYVEDFNDKQIYNLGFGDFDIETDEINDESMSDNDDVYRVFNTVLSTIPDFLRNIRSIL